MFSTNQHRTPSRKQLRSFGLILAGGFLVIGFWPMIFRHQGAARWAVATSFTFAAAGMFVPAALRQAYRIWMTLGDWLGWINSKVILGTLYYALVTPLRILMAIAGHYPMNRKFDPNSSTYRVIRKRRPVSHMTHQF